MLLLNLVVLYFVYFEMRQHVERPQRRMRLIVPEQERVFGERDQRHVEDETTRRDLGHMSEVCQTCGAYRFDGEKTVCCFGAKSKKKGRIALPKALPPYPFVHMLNNPETGKIFLRNARRLNNALAMAAPVTKIDRAVQPFTYKILGAHHQLVSRHLDALAPGANDSFMNWWLFDPTEQRREARLHTFFGDNLRELALCHDMFAYMEQFERVYNPLMRVLRRVAEVQQSQPPLAPNAPRPQLFLLGDSDGRNGCERRYNQPQADEIAMILPDNDNPGAQRRLQMWWEAGKGRADLTRLEQVLTGDASSHRLLIFNAGPPAAPPPPPLPPEPQVGPEQQQPNPRMTQRVPETHALWDPLRYPLLLPYGSLGWGRHLDKQWTMAKHTRYFLATRNATRRQQLPLDFNSFGMLFQEYCVDQWVKVESNTMNFIRFNQTNIRRAHYNKFERRLADGVGNFDEISQRVILPHSVLGSTRDRQSRFYNAMAAARALGNPQLFVTFTANPDWREIRDNLRPSETAMERPDLTARVFKLKLEQLLDSLGIRDPNDHRYFDRLGACRWILYSIEFQKRGLPHAHILITYSNAITAEIADSITRAELPDPVMQPRLYAAVTEKLLHVCTRDRCLDENGICKRRFPRTFVDVTTVDEKGQVHLRRRNNPDNTVQRKIKDKNGREVMAQLGNNFVVPHSPELTLEYDAHINVEIVGSDPNAPPTPQLFKYVVKYLFKGQDRIIAAMSHENARIDEIANYINSRYISAHEAIWRLFEYDMYVQKPACEVLELHLPGENMVHLNPNQLDRAALEKKRHTKLTRFLEYVQSHDEHRNRLYYVDLPKEATWNKQRRQWTKRVNDQSFPSVGRLAWIHPRMVEQFYLRMLLLHVPGPSSFDDLRTVDGHLYPTFLEAARARGLAHNDNEWRITLQDAVAIMTSGRQLRQLLCDILNNNAEAITDPAALWNVFATELSMDLAYQMRHLPELRGASEEDIEHDAHILALRAIRDGVDIENILQRLPLPNPVCRLNCALTAAQRVEHNKLLARETNVQPDELCQYWRVHRPLLNHGQKVIVDLFVAASRDGGHQALGLLNAPGGTGKTFVIKLILAWYRGRERKVAMATAATGIAAELLPLGDTVHKKFGIPIPTEHNSVAGFTRPDTHMAAAVREAKLIVVDEVFSLDARIIECLERSLRELHGNNQPWGGVSVLLSGDPRQCTPVVKGGDRAEVVEHSIVGKAVLDNFRVFNLTTNMRLADPRLNDQQRAERRNFGDWLLRIGEGREQIVYGEHGVTLPQRFVHTQSEQEFITSVYTRLSERARHFQRAAAAAVVPLGPLQTQAVAIATQAYQVELDRYATFLSQRSILSPLNRSVSILNDRINAMVPGQETVLVSDDTVERDPGTGNVRYPRNAENVDGLLQLAQDIPPEVLHAVDINSWPPHELKLKPGSVAMVWARNISPQLRNGTRVVILRIQQFCIRAAIVTGPHKGTEVLIPRIKYVDNTYESGLPFVISRCQFPLRLSWAMTINKAQGQTLSKAWLYLNDQPFAHGQLYVALSRAIAPESICIYTTKRALNGAPIAHNIVWPELLLNGAAPVAAAHV